MFSSCVFVHLSVFVLWFFFFKQKTAYEMRISDWSSDVCSSDLLFMTNLAPKRSWEDTDGRDSNGKRPRGDRRLGLCHQRVRLCGLGCQPAVAAGGTRSEEHTSELQSLMRISYAVFCLIKKKK